jgi:hypothetical protein
VTVPLSDVQRSVLAALDVRGGVDGSAAADELAPDVPGLGPIETDAVLADLQKLGLADVTTGGSTGHTVIRAYRITDLGRDAVVASA